MTIAEFLNDLEDYGNKHLLPELGLEKTVIFDWQFHGIEKKKKNTTFYIKLHHSNNTVEKDSEQLASRIPALTKIRMYKKSKEDNLSEVTSRNQTDLLCEAKAELRFLVIINLAYLEKIQKTKSKQFWEYLANSSGYRMKYNPFY